MTRSMMNVQALRDKGIRFKHFYDLKGRLVGTIVTKPFNSEYVAVAASICAHMDVPDKETGRRLALKRLRAKQAILKRGDELADAIRDRTILREFPGGKGLPRLRPPQPFFPRPRVKSMEMVDPFEGDDLPF